MRWTIAICALLGLTALQDSIPLVHQQGELQLHDASAVDLDEGHGALTFRLDGEDPPIQATETFKGSDFWFQAGKRRYFHPQHGAMFAKTNAGPVRYANCANAAYSRSAIKIDQLPGDAQICLRTNEGRYSSIQIIRYIPESGRLSITYTTWEKATPASASKPAH